MNASYRLKSSRGLSAAKQSRRSCATSALPRLQPLDDEYSTWHTFDTYANWLIPGSVLLGRYPFVEVGGVDTFLCIQAELPPQDQMKLGGKDGFLPYRATAELIQAALNDLKPSVNPQAALNDPKPSVNPQAALNGPPPIEGLHALRTPDLNKFLPPKKKQASSSSEVIPDPPPRKTLNFLHHPIVDLGLPDSKESLSLLLKDLQARLKAGEKLYIHCWGGRGRAGTIGACLLGRAYGLSADEALLRVQRAFDTRMEGRKSPETDAQHGFVKEYIAGL